MKGFALFTAIFATAICSLADSTNFLERFSPHFPANTEILWQASTNRLPQGFWIYKRLPPRPFSASVISNAVILLHCRVKDFRSLPRMIFLFGVPPIRAA
jgi:hypothetical protein